MTNEYDPGTFDRAPHQRRQCPCGETVIVVGWEVETSFCGRCGAQMEWVEDLYNPREYP